jgi:nucleoid-associated protein YgaU
MTADLSAANLSAANLSAANPIAANLSAAGGTTSKWVRATPSGTGLVGTAGVASLKKVYPGPKPGEPPEIKFSLNPERISVSHTYKTEGATGNTLTDQINSLGNIEIIIDKILLFGPGTKSNCDTLIDWSCPAPPKMRQQTSEPISLRLLWGTGISYQVYLRQVSITYTRFAEGTGNPIRAEVRLNLYRGLTTTLPPTNPTSGGPAGRSSHVVDSSECLASLAQDAYGRPGAWRRIAQANSIDDPLRVRPGTQLYLPEPGEPAAGGRR